MVGGRTIPWYCRNRAMPMEGKRTIVYIEANYYQSFYNKLIFHFSSKIKEVLA